MARRWPWGWPRAMYIYIFVKHGFGWLPSLTLNLILPWSRWSGKNPGANVMEYQNWSCNCARRQHLYLMTGIDCECSLRVVSNSVSFFFGIFLSYGTAMPILPEERYKSTNYMHAAMHWEYQHMQRLSEPCEGK